MSKAIDLTAAGIAVVILAAGTSTRMAGKHKLTLPLHDGRTVLEHTVEQAAGWHPAQLVVVMQPDISGLPASVAGPPVEVVPNPDYSGGMSTSLRLGVASLRQDVEAALILLGDQPLVEGAIIEALVEAYNRDAKAITIPVYGDIPGPPTLFRREVFPELLASTGDEGGRPVVRRDPRRVARVVLPGGAMPPDIDTPEDYNQYLSKVSK